MRNPSTNLMNAIEQLCKVPQTVDNLKAALSRKNIENELYQLVREEKLRRLLGHSKERVYIVRRGVEDDGAVVAFLAKAELARSHRLNKDLVA